MITNEMIMDRYRAQGSSYDDYQSVTGEMAGITKDLVVHGNDIQFLSLCEIPELEVEGKLNFYVLNQEYIRKMMEEGKRLMMGRVSRDEIPEPVLDELRRTTGLIAMIGEDKYIVSDIAIPTLTIRASVSGDMTISRQNLIRNLHLADAIFTKNEKIHLVYREIDYVNEDGSTVKVRKIFAGLGKVFQPVAQTILEKTVDLIASTGEMGKPEIREWNVDHRFTDLYIEFPKCASEFQELYELPDAIIPGLFLCTSDVGASSVIVRGVYSSPKRRGYVITDEVAIKHTSEVSPSSILEKVDSGVFQNMRKLPEALAELIGKSVIDYSKADLTTEEGRESNFQAVLDVVEKTLDKLTKKLRKTVLPKKRQDQLLTCLRDEINSSIPYTLYDIAITFLEMSDRISGLDDVSLNELRKVFANAPYVLKDSKLIRFAAEEEAGIYLLPS